MTDTRRQAALTVAALLVLGAWTMSCSGSNSPTTQIGDDGGAIPTNTKKVPITGASGSATCPLDGVTKSVEAKYPGATIANDHVSLNAGIATIFPKDGEKKGIVGFFQASGDGCPLVKEAAPDSDVNAAAPPDFPVSLIDQWKSEYVDPSKPKTTTTTAPPSNGGGGGDGGGGGCGESGCSTTTTAKPTTTVTAPTTTSTTRPPTTTTTGPPQTIIVRG